MIRTSLIAATSLALLAGCGDRRNDQFAFDGQFYRAGVSRVDRDRQQFTVTARPVSASFQGALEAAVYEAIKYCVNTYGSSEIEWLLGPDQEPDSYVVENDALALRGNCEG